MTMLGRVSRTHRRIESSLVRSMSGKSTQVMWAIGARVRRSSQPTWPIFPMSRIRGGSMDRGSAKQPLRWNVAETQSFGVTLGEEWFVQRPFDSDVRIVPADSRLVGRRVELGAFVMEERGFTEHGKPVRESRRDIELPLVLGVQDQAVPLPKGARAAPDVHGDVEHLPLQHLEQLALRVRILKMQASQDATARE